MTSGSSVTRLFRLPPLPSISEIVRLYNLTARKQLSQNFLLDANLTRKIVRCAGDLEGAHVCEVGPGPGGITRALLEAGVSHLAVVEKDQRFIPSLELLRDASGDIMKIYQGDILKFDTGDLFPIDTAAPTWDSPPPRLHLIGNLPFSVSTPLIIKWLESVSIRSGAWRNGRVKMTLTFQKEVAERMAAPVFNSFNPNYALERRTHSVMNKQRCRLSVICQTFCHIEHKFTIPGRAFTPAPDVDVGVVRLTPRIKPLIEGLSFSLIEKVLRHIFHYRQKMCKHAIQTLFPPDRPDLTRLLIERSDIHADSRCFALSIEDFNRICHSYKELCDMNEGLFEYDYRSQENAKLWRTNLKRLEI